MAIRLCKLSLVAASFLFLLLVVFNNVTDYGSNYEFVKHVLSMDTTFPDNRAMWRAISAPAAHHVFYWSIICWEAVACGMVGLGAWRLWQTRQLPNTAWRRAKKFAAVGLTVSLLQWYVAFLCVGAEWFLMWQSKIWNGQDSALRMFAVMGISLLFLCQGDDDLEPVAA